MKAGENLPESKAKERKGCDTDQGRVIGLFNATQGITGVRQGVGMSARPQGKCIKAERNTQLVKSMGVGRLNFE